MQSTTSRVWTFRDTISQEHSTEYSMISFCRLMEYREVCHWLRFDSLTGFETVCRQSAATTGYLYKVFLLPVVGTTILQPVGFSWSIGLWSFSRSGNRSHLSTRHCFEFLHWTHLTHLAFAWGHCQESISTCQPMSCCSRNTIPQRETSESQARHLQESLHTGEPLNLLVCTPPVLGLIVLDCKSYLCPMLCNFSQQAVRSPKISQIPGAPAVAGDATAKSSTCKLYQHTPQITCVDSNQNRWSNLSSTKTSTLSPVPLQRPRNSTQNGNQNSTQNGLGSKNL